VLGRLLLEDACPKGLDSQALDLSERRYLSELDVVCYGFEVVVV